MFKRPIIKPFNQTFHPLTSSIYEPPLRSLRKDMRAEYRQPFRQIPLRRRQEVTSSNPNADSLASCRLSAVGNDPHPSALFCCFWRKKLHAQKILLLENSCTTQIFYLQPMQMNTGALISPTVVGFLLHPAITDLNQLTAAPRAEISTDYQTSAMWTSNDLHPLTSFASR